MSRLTCAALTMSLKTADKKIVATVIAISCLLYTSDAADDVYQV